MQPSYRVLKRDQLEERRKQAIADVVSVTGIAAEDAVRVLRKYKWCVVRVETTPSFSLM